MSIPYSVFGNYDWAGKCEHRLPACNNNSHLMPQIQSLKIKDLQESSRTSGRAVVGFKTRQSVNNCDMTKQDHAVAGCTGRCREKQTTSWSQQKPAEHSLCKAFLCSSYGNHAVAVFAGTTQKRHQPIMLKLVASSGIPSNPFTSGSSTCIGCCLWMMMPTRQALLGNSCLHHHVQLFKPQRACFQATARPCSYLLLLLVHLMHLWAHFMSVTAHRPPWSAAMALRAPEL